MTMLDRELGASLHIHTKKPASRRYSVVTFDHVQEKVPFVIPFVLPEDKRKAWVEA